jgi:hypothetical protein
MICFDFTIGAQFAHVDVEIAKNIAVTVIIENKIESIEKVVEDGIATVIKGSYVNIEVQKLD